MGQIHSKEDCTRALTGIGDALYVIGGKWKLRIIIALVNSNKRFNELQRTRTGISARVLSHEVKELEMDGFVRRNIYTENAVVVEYELTEYSESLSSVLSALSEWGIMHREKIRKERSVVEAVLRE